MSSESHDTLQGSHLEEKKDIEFNSPHDAGYNPADDSMETATQAEEGFDGGKLQKKSTKASVNNISSVPDGGLRAWLQVVGAFFLFFNTWGILNTYGAYQTFYETGELFQSNSSTISWIGSLQAFLLLTVGCLTGPVYDAGYIYHLLWVGSFLVVFGQMMLSLCHTFWQALLAQAFCIGIGSGCLFIPCVAMLSTYFHRHLALSMGIAAAGSGMGGVIYPIVFHRLQPQIGFAWTTRVIGFMILATLAIPLGVMKVRVIPASKRKLVDWVALTEPAYVLFVIGGLISFMGIYVPFFYIQYFAIATGVTDENLGFYLLAILNTASIAGRIVPNFIADKIGPFNVVVPCGLASGVVAFGLLGTHSIGAVVVLAILYGFFSGTFVSLPPACFVMLSPNRGLIGTRMGMGFSIIALGGLTGSPIAGAILKSKGWVGVWAFAGATACAGALLMGASRMVRSGGKMVVKV